MSKKDIAVFEVGDSKIDALGMIPNFDVYFSKGGDLAQAILCSVCIVNCDGCHGCVSQNIMFLHEGLANGAASTATVD